MSPFAKKGDIWIVGAIVLTAFLIWLFYDQFGSAAYADIYEDGAVVRTIDLSKAQNETFTVNGVTIQVKDHTIGIIDSTCPDKLCVHAGFLSKQNQSAICLPNRVAIRLRGGGDAEYDTIVG